MKTYTEIKIGRDVNGNRIATLRPIGKRGFSIQTLGSLPFCHRQEIGSSLHAIDGGNGLRAFNEFKGWVLNHGTKRQREIVSSIPFSF